MNSLSHYEKSKEPVVLRQDYIKNGKGVGYYGSKMKAAELLFAYNISPTNSGANGTTFFNTSKRSSSSLMKKSNAKSPHRPPSNVKIKVIIKLCVVYVPDQGSLPVRVVKHAAKQCAATVDPQGRAV